MNPATEDAVRAEPHVEIGSLLQRYADEIVDRWCRAAREEGSAAQCAHHTVLRDQLPEFVRGMGFALKHVGPPDSHRRSAGEHGDQRWDSGWSLGELVRDYQLMRLVVLEFLEERLTRPLLYREAMAVGVFMDDAIALSIKRYVTHRDGTRQRKELERTEALQELSQRKDEFLAILGHELRNPLAPIRNSVAVLRQLLTTPAPSVAMSLDVLDRQSQQLGRLVDDLLDIARIGRGEFELRKSRVDLRVPVEQALQMTDELVKSRQHRLSLAICEAPLVLDADSHRVAQIVANLLSNAAKYTDAGGNIWLTVEQDANDAVIRVRDDGIGIPPDMLARVFELFTRFEPSKAAGRDGLGVGLALVHRLVQQHDGTIVAHSEGRGRGTEFVVRLPMFASDAVADTEGSMPMNQVLVIKQVPVDKV